MLGLVGQNHSDTTLDHSATSACGQLALESRVSDNIVSVTG